MGQNPLFRDTYFVLYAATAAAQSLIAARMYAAGYRAVDHDSVTRAGGYGARLGCLVFEDPDGYRVILDHTGDLPFGGVSDGPWQPGSSKANEYLALTCRDSQLFGGQLEVESRVYTYGLP
jgi:hypothetical protein